MKIAPGSQTITGSLDDWERWTGVPMRDAGPVIVPHALSPVHCVPTEGYAVYVEPNVWMRHDLT